MGLALPPQLAAQLLMGKQQMPRTMLAVPPPVRMAGDVIEKGPVFQNLQQSNAITRSLDRSNQMAKPPAPVVPLIPKK